MEETQERSLHREAVKIEIAEPPTRFSELDPDVQLAIRSASEKKAFDMIALDLRNIASFTDFFIIASASNQRQVQAIADAVIDQLKKQLEKRPVRIEGYNAAEWLVLDYGEFALAGKLTILELLEQAPCQ